MDLFLSNRVLDSGVSVTASSENELLIAENLLKEHRAKYWQTTTSTADEYVVFDLGTAGAAIEDVILSDYDTSLSGDTVKIQGNATDSWGSPSVDETITASKFNNGDPAVHALSSGGSYRYWRLSITKASAGVTRYVGHIYLGVITTLSEEPDHEGVDIGTESASSINRSRGGNAYVDEKPKLKTFTVPFSDVTAVKAEVESLAADGALYEPFWMRITSVSGDTELVKYHYVRNEEVPDFEVVGYTGSAYIYDFELNLIEEL